MDKPAEIPCPVCRFIEIDTSSSLKEGIENAFCSLTRYLAEFEGSAKELESYLRRSFCPPHSWFYENLRENMELLRGNA